MEETDPQSGGAETNRKPIGKKNRMSLIPDWYISVSHSPFQSCITHRQTSFLSFGH